MAKQTLLRAILVSLGGLGLVALAESCSPAPSAEETPAPVAAAIVAAPKPMQAAAPAAADGRFAVRSVLAPDRPLGPRDYLWELSGIPAGELRIVVDLQAEMLYAYRGGYEIGRAFIAYGADEKPTPLGTFPILEKKVDHVSNLYDAEMPYMMRLTWDGIAIHGSELAEGVATHGCIGVPDEFAALLFAEAKLGDTVTITRGWSPTAAVPPAAPTLT